MNYESVEVVVPVEYLTDAPVVGTLTLRRGLALGLDPRRASEAALVASELATNIVKYAGGGEISLEHVVDQGLWIVARDRGAGPPSEEQLFSDGVSRGRRREPDDPRRDGLGSGGAAVRRFSDEAHLGQRLGGGSEVRCLIRVKR